MVQPVLQLRLPLLPRPLKSVVELHPNPEAEMLILHLVHRMLVVFRVIDPKRRDLRV
jgi:hypothetical protein